MYEPKMREFTDASSNDFHLRAKNQQLRAKNNRAKNREPKIDKISEPKISQNRNDFQLRAQNPKRGLIFKHLNLLTQARMTFSSEPKIRARNDFQLRAKNPEPKIREPKIREPKIRDFQLRAKNPKSEPKITSQKSEPKINSSEPKFHNFRVYLSALT
jgi:hypothetical protein